MNFSYKNPLSKHLFVPHDLSRKHSPQVSKNQSFQSHTKPSILSESEVNRITNENNFLRQENQKLKKEVESLREQQWKHPSGAVNLRDTIKKEVGQVKQLKMRLQIVAKQCTVYEEIIHKMEERIKKLNTECKKLTEIVELNKIKSEQLERLTKYADEVNEDYRELQLKIQASDLEWSLFKEHWEQQRKYYIEKIKSYERSYQNNSRPTSSH